jgi:hypothetical protein
MYLGMYDTRLKGPVSDGPSNTHVSYGPTVLGSTVGVVTAMRNLFMPGCQVAVTVRE